MSEAANYFTQPMSLQWFAHLAQAQRPYTHALSMLGYSILETVLWVCVSQDEHIRPTVFPVEFQGLMCMQTTGIFVGNKGVFHTVRVSISHPLHQQAPLCTLTGN